MKRAVTIHDIAKKANTSSATVSRVLSNKDYPVSAELKQRIKRIAKEMQYVPNMLGRQLKTNKGNTIGVIVPTISNPFYSATVLGVEETARERGYQVLLCNAHRRADIENQYLQTLLEKQVKGVIISSISSSLSKLNELSEQGLHIIAIDQKLPAKSDVLSHAHQIHFDFFQGGYLATQYLIRRGHRKIAFVTAPPDRSSRQGVLEGYRAALETHRIAYNASWLLVADMEKEGYGENYEFNNGKMLTRKLLQQPEKPTAIFAINDMTAFGVMNELNAQGLQVPQHMSVIGFDNIEFSQMVTPSLTTIEQPKYTMGQLACNLLLDILNDEGGHTARQANHVESGSVESGSANIELQPVVIERNSVLDLNKK